MNITPYQVHPMLVHFPIALLFVSAVFEWAVPWIFKAQRERWRWVAVCLLWAGTLLAGLAIASGLWAESTAPAIPSAWDTVGWHKNLGIAVGVFSAVLSVWRIFRGPPATPRPWILYALLWIVLVVVLALTGFYGGRLVFDYGVGVDATSGA